jgi:hypothetical protein
VGGKNEGRIKVSRKRRLASKGRRDWRRKVAAGKEEEEEEEEDGKKMQVEREERKQVVKRVEV